VVLGKQYYIWEDLLYITNW